MERSKLFMLLGALIALPIVFIDSPSEALGPSVFYLLSCVALLSSVTGGALWAIEHRARNKTLAKN